jgi:hypothetical protein
MRRNPPCQVLLAAMAILLFAGTPSEAAHPTCKLDPKGLTICFGSYALCDKATCKSQPGGTTAECTCPVEVGASFADPGQTNGTCTPSNPGGVYSFFSLQGLQPNSMLACAKGSHWAQCWNAPCELLPGGKEAKCVCPLCNSSFVTPGGDCNPANCTSEILVGAGFPVKGSSGCKGK